MQWLSRGLAPPPKRWLWLLVSAQLAAGITVALDPDRSLTQYMHESWQVDAGLPQASVLDVLRTTDGYLWVGTFEGLARFDGVHFEVFDKVNTPAITNNGVWALAEDSRHRLCVGTNGGGLLVLDNGSFTRLDGLPNPYITTLLVDSQARLWIGTREGLCQLDGETLTLFPGALATSFVWSLAEDGSGAIWAGTDAGAFRLRGDRVDPFDTRSGLPSSTVRSLSWDAGRRLLFAGTPETGLLVFRDERWQVYPQASEVRDIRAILADVDGNLWIGTQQDGLFRLNNGSLAHLSEADGLTDSNIYALLEDAEGCLWIGTYRGGLNRLRDGKFLTYTEQEGLSEDQVRTVFADRSGVIWIGTVGGGADRLFGGHIETLDTTSGLSHNMVWSLTQSRDGAIWLGTYGGGLNRFDGKVTTVLNNLHGLSHDIIRTVREDSGGTLWIGTNGKGIDLLRPDGSLDHLTKANGLCSDFIYALLEDSSGAMWIGTYECGLMRYRGGTVDTFTTEDGLPSRFVWALREDESEPGVLWIGTNGGGLCRYRDGVFTSYTTRDGLYNDAVFAVVDDGRGRLWMSSNKGIFTVSKQELERFDKRLVSRLSCTSYGRSEGMKTWACNGPSDPAGIKDSSGKLWFPTTKGIVVIDPDHVPVNEFVPPVAVERFLVDGADVDLRSPIVLAPGSRRFEMRYTGLSLQAAEKVQFRYRLDGLDHDWIDVSTRREAFYNNLRPGRYVFHVTACNNDGLWNKDGASVAFVLRPFFYQTRAFQVLAVIGVFLLGAGVAMIRVRQLKHHQRLLQRLVNERTEELAKANKELHRLADLDGLTGIANHRHFEEFYQREWRRCQRDASPMSVIMADVDFFKSFNDTYGHQAGDDCLRAVASALSNGIHRPSDLVARYGGEEFVLVLGDTPEAGALHVAEQLRHGVEAMRIPHSGGVTGFVTISAGVVSDVPHVGDESAELIGRADAALFEAKRSGRNCVKVSSGQVAASGEQ